METQTAKTNGTSEMSGATMSAMQAKAIIDNVERTAPERWPAAAKTLLIEAFATLERNSLVTENLQKNYDKLVASHRRLAAVVILLQNEVRTMKPGEQAPSTVEETLVGSAQTSAEPGTPENPGAVPVTGDEAASSSGTPDAPVSQDVAEAMMDAAIAAAGSEQSTAEAVPPVEPVVQTGSGRRRGGK